MDGCRVTLTFGTTLRFGSLSFVYTRPMEPIAGRTFARPPRPNVLMEAAEREAFVRGFSDDVIVACWGQTQRRSVLGRRLLPHRPRLPGQLRRTARLGGVHGAVHRNVAPWIARPPGRPSDGLRQRPPHDWCCPWVYDDLEGTDCVTP
jgi:hypothetical protein